VAFLTGFFTISFIDFDLSCFYLEVDKGLIDLDLFTIFYGVLAGLLDLETLLRFVVLDFSFMLSIFFF
jgi:hypothetical protein